MRGGLLATVAAAIVATAIAAIATTAATTTTATVAAATTAAAATTTETTAVATITTATATETTGTGRAFFTRTSNVHGKGTAFEFVAVEFFYGLLRFVTIAHRDESEAARAASEFVEDNLNDTDGANLAKQSFEVLGGAGEGKVPHVELAGF
jgi:hypothetical protein